ncbi:MAG: NRDE family protein [Planctomycetota bacterium]
MCTVTIVPIPGSAGAFRMACSRDESHGRAPAQSPTRSDHDGVRALMPIDPSSGGTWVGVNEHGLALTLLNYNLPEPPTGRDRSRGDVIPVLLGAHRIHEVVQMIESIERERMMPFRVVGCDGESVLLWRSTEPVERVVVDPFDGEPAMWTSSGLGDHLVEGPRRELFDGWFSDEATSRLDEQLTFHRHQWPGREHLSVCMHRDDARTVSYTTVDVGADRISMVYHPDRPDREAQQTRADLERGLVQR